MTTGIWGCSLQECLLEGGLENENVRQDVIFLLEKNKQEKSPLQKEVALIQKIGKCSQLTVYSKVRYITDE
jgi:hypothetical protein